MQKETLSFKIRLHVKDLLWMPELTGLEVYDSVFRINVIIKIRLTVKDPSLVQKEEGKTFSVNLKDKFNIWEDVIDKTIGTPII